MDEREGVGGVHDHDPGRTIVRPATPADLRGIAGLTDLPPATRRLLADDLAEPARRHVLVATDGPRGAVLGVVVGTRQPDAVHVLDVVVDRSARRRGVGALLVGALARAAVADGTDALTLEVRTGNDAARALYAALGFEDVGIRPGYYQDGEDAHVLWHDDPAALAAGTAGPD